MSERYVCSLLDAVRCVAPASLGSRVEAVTRLTDPALRGSDLGASIHQAHIVETLRSLGRRGRPGDPAQSGQP